MNRPRLRKLHNLARLVPMVAGAYWKAFATLTSGVLRAVRTALDDDVSSCCPTCGASEMEIAEPCRRRMMTVDHGEPDPWHGIRR